MNRIRALSRMDWVFSFVGLLLLLFILVPLLATLFASSPGEFIEGVADKGILASLRLTFVAAFVATVIALILGTLAYLLPVGILGRICPGIIDLPIIIAHGGRSSLVNGLRPAGVPERWRRSGTSLELRDRRGTLVVCPAGGLCTRWSRS